MHKKCKVCYPSVISQSSRAVGLVQKFMPLSLAVLFWLIFQWMWVSGILKQIDRPEQWDYSKPSLNRTAAFSQLNSLHSFKILMTELGLTSWEKHEREGWSAQWGKVFGNVSLIIITQTNLGCVDTFFFNKLCFLSSVAFLSLSEYWIPLQAPFWRCPCMNMYGRTLRERQRPWVDNEGWGGTDRGATSCESCVPHIRL